MNFFEKFMLALLAIAEADVPIFVHSTQGIAVLNASENVVNGLVSSFTAKPAATPTPITQAVGSGQAAAGLIR